MRGWLIAGLIGLGLSCGGAPPNVPRSPTSSPSPWAANTRQLDPVVILTIDGVRWQEIFEGTDPELAEPSRREPPQTIAPNLYRLGTERGAFIGAPTYGTISASGPEYVSLPGYTEIFSGVREHGCLNNECTRTTTTTILDRAAMAGAKVAAFASWTKVALALSTKPGLFPMFCGPRNLSDIEHASPPVRLEEQRSDHDTADAALRFYEAERPDVFYLGLGEPDEYAHHGNYEGYLAAIHRADDVLGRILTLLDQDERGRRATIVVLPDHGRSKWFHSHGGVAPEAARVWLVAGGPRIRARGFASSTRAHHLYDVAPTVAEMIGLAEPERPVIAELFSEPADLPHASLREPSPAR